MGMKPKSLWGVVWFWLGCVALVLGIKWMAERPSREPASEPLALEAMKGRPSGFTLEEVGRIKNSGTLQEHQKAILVQGMLASVDDPARKEQALNASREYEEKGAVPWARDFLKMSRAFMLEEMGRREEAAVSFEELFRGNHFEDIEDDDDFIVRELMKNYSARPGEVFQGMICDHLGDHYLLHSAKGRDAERALYFYDSIPVRAMRVMGFKEYNVRMKSNASELDLSGVREKYNAEYRPEGNWGTPKFRSYHEEFRKRLPLILVGVAILGVAGTWASFVRRRRVRAGRQLSREPRGARFAG